jgi:Tol biopolymer transport system component
MTRLIVILCAAILAAFGQQDIYPAAKDGGNYMHNYYVPPAPGSYPWYPDWGPAGKYVAVSLLGSIWKVDVATGDAEQLTYDRRYHSSADWSPDGKWIIYTADENNRNVQLAILNVATGETRSLTEDQHLYLDPVFSPSGDRVAYVSTYPNGHFNVYVRPIRNGAWSGPPVAVTTHHQYLSHRDRRDRH